MRARGIVDRVAMYTVGVGSCWRVKLEVASLEARVTELENDYVELAIKAEQLRGQLGAERVDRQEAFESLWRVLDSNTRGIESAKRVLDSRTDHLV